MNILPKKSWHVRNKDNVEKVRKDEENARIEAKEQSHRAALAEQEARTNFLRKKARSRTLESSNDLKMLLHDEDHSEQRNVLSVAFSHAGSDSQSLAISSSMKNEEHEIEKKEEQVSYEKKIGLLTFLGQSAAETKNDCDKPWYFKTPKRKLHKDSNSSSEDETDEKDLKHKASMDPIQAMKSHLQKKKLADEYSKKHKKHKHKRKHNHYGSSIEKDLTPRGHDKLAKMRQERLKREKREREKTMALLNGSESNAVEEQPGRYNSQFNPHLVRARTYSDRHGRHPY